jgi:hypothetical protein
LPTPVTDLSKLGYDITRFGQLTYAERVQEYPRTQEIAEVAHFHNNDAILVPNARWDCTNLVIFMDRVSSSSIEVVADHGPIDWTIWKAKNRKT